jgi:TIR domain
MKRSLFVSYSRADKILVGALAKFLRTATTEAVFRDEDGIAPGAKWAETIRQAIGGARLFYVFWCAHSASSDAVKTEYTLAITLDKPVIPVLLDDTKLTKSLAQYQYLDLRSIAHDVHAKRPTSKKRGMKERALPPLVSGFVSTAIASIWLREHAPLLGAGIVLVLLGLQFIRARRRPAGPAEGELDPSDEVHLRSMAAAILQNSQDKLAGDERTSAETRP